VRECLANQSGCDATALGDELVEEGFQCGQHARVPRLNEHAERSPHGEATLVCHFAAYLLANLKRISFCSFKSRRPSRNSSLALLQESALDLSPSPPGTIAVYAFD
jgi:hypothetical protein